MSQISPIAIDTAKQSAAPAAPKLGNPAVVGLAGFGLTTLMLQFHNLGLAGIGPVIWLGFFFGGLAQMIAGLQEQKMGNNFGYCAFTSFGCFWISLCAILVAKNYNLFPVSKADVGWFLIGWSLFSTILWIGSIKISKAMFLTFTTLMIGFVLLDLEHFVPRSTRVAKRIVDVVVAGLVFLVFAATFPFIGLAIRLESKGPLFYRQLRVGEATPRFTRLFYMIKYRTMRVDAEARSGAMWATANDPRVTRVGRFLRKTRLDELPQCLNVLAGDMSIIGPRPERPSFFKTLESAIPFYAERTYGVRPGISGLAQVNQRYDTSIEDVRSKVLHDHAYAMRLTTPLGWMKADVAIVFRTAWVMVTGRGQ